ncbi:tetratricopeptide repeat protein [Plebeiibacterium sediminum]|uniref:Tetratricopeptide repeat protein n=1 Tax=Plebeiibacterium sediminum TaxID=2992112 RepID=A0AAE3SGZ8_9BACT|nr:hypothetical protein [Plebeiobacterium sediminum]MCW3787818.1 hypothetical protein [Plebeiobacterium sediminum]
MKSILFVILLAISSLSTIRACGWDPYYSYSYHLFNQHYIQQKGYDAFLKDELMGSWSYEHSKPVISKNVALWKELLPTWNSEDITKALTDDATLIFEQLWSGKKNGHKKAVYDYMVYARACSDHHQSRKQRSWSYSDMVDVEVVDLSELIAEGVEQFNASGNPQLKLRYAYQIIRNYHYSKRYQEAVQFYNKFVKDQFAKSEIYYYVQDQVAGCYYSLEDYEKAAYLFLQVFSNSYDRKVSSYTSYKFCTDRGAEGKEYFSGSDDRATYLTLKSIRSYSDQVNYLQEMAEVAPHDEKLELLFVRELYNIEDDVLPRRIGLKDEKLLCSDPENYHWDEINALEQISAQQETVSKAERKDFWLLCSSYLKFLKGDVDAAKIKLNEITLITNYRAMTEELKVIYQVFSWSSLGSNQESFLTKILADSNLNNNVQQLIEDYAGHLLFHQGKLAQSFLVHHSILEIENMGSLPLLNNLKAFLEQPDKSSFEKYLLEQNVKDQTALMNPLEYINYHLGMYYLNQGDAREALIHFNSSRDYKTSNGIGMVVPAKVFSNNIREGFDCPDDLMEDSVYLASMFSFIEPELTKKQLAFTLIKLDSLRNDEKSWKRKLANYLLGNYYFNVSNTGYYRGVLQDKSNCCNSYYFGVTDESIIKRDKQLEERSGYNLCNVSYGKKTYNPLADKAYRFYRNTIELSTDKELNARCLYMMAKCELNHLYNHKTNFAYWYYDGALKDEILDYKKSFKELKEQYQDTRFFDRIIKECSFFRYYCSQ